jgi:amino acid adenylation domain-containing protein
MNEQILSREASWKERMSKEKCIHELFEEQAHRSPDAVAAVCEGRALSYRVLNSRSNQLANYLRELGVGPEKLIAICLERSLELLVGLLAILKAGGAYVPIDPNNPQERFAFILEDTQAPVLLTQRSLRARLQETGAKVVCLDGDWEEIDRQSTSAPSDLVTTTNLAYVIYTSGSTGKPKGVLVEHAGMVNLVYQHHELYCAKEGIRISQTANVSFDSMGSEIWPALLSGATLCIAPNELRADPEGLQRWLIDQRIAIAFVTTVIAERLLALSWPEEDIALRVLRFGGERFRGRPSNRSYPFKVYNEYGPTEDTVWTTTAEVVDESAGEPGIGRPIAGHRIYVLDRNQHPVPLGIAGELCIAGIGLARGYLNRPELTTEKFIRNPFSEDPKERIYRTGDLVRYLPDGNLEFLRRIDQQIKIRGFRIEPGEIETVLSQHPGVQESVVVAREDIPGEKRLVAYVVARSALKVEAAESLPDRQFAEWEQVLDQHVYSKVADDLTDNSSQELAPQLRSYLLGKLPDYMVPSAVVFLEELPLTANGKLDRRALPKPVALQCEAVLVPPRDALETQLVAIWEKALTLQPIGITDNFFELGGNSLLAVRIFAEIERTLGKRLPLAMLFEMPTVESLAPRVRQATRPEDWGPLVAIRLQGARPPFFGIHGRDGNVLLFRRFSQLLGQEQPFYGLQAQGLYGGPIERTSVEAMAAYYLEEIRKVQPHGPYLLGGYSFGGLPAYEIARHLGAAGEEVALLMLFATNNPAQATRVRSWMQVARQAVRGGITVKRSLEFLAGCARGKLGDNLLKWNEALHRLTLGSAAKRGRNAAAELIDIHVQMVHERAFLAYRPLPYGGKVTLFRTFDQDSAYEVVEDLGWNAVAQGGVDIHYVPGTHLTIFSEENVPILAKKVEECVQSALSQRK